MILTTKARYAVMAIIEISSQKTNKPLSLNEIARSQNISLSYLEQIFTHLKKNNIVKSVKGPGGGYILSKEKSQITVSDIIKAIDEPIKMTRCTLDKSGCIATNNKTKCKTHHLWHGLENRIYDYLNSISLDKL
jgi:Rrf2 family transcriptional regulator, iron-sulfur cluster assembly transcription factor